MNLDPGKVYEYVLTRQRDNPATIKFEVELLSARKALAAAVVRDELIETEGAETRTGVDLLLSGIGIGVRSFTTNKKANVTDLSQLLDIVTISDLYELLNVVIYGPPLDYETKKNSA